MSQEHRGGLPNIAIRDPEALEQERRYLSELAMKPFAVRFAGYLRLSGPGWLQSAFTLGGGTLTSSLLAGTLLGYALLWVQPVAMICGVIMLSAVAYQTLSTRMRPLDAVRRHVHPLMAWAWALSALLSSVIWAMPQFSLSISVLEDILGQSLGTAGTLVASFSIFLLVWLITCSYGKSSGVRIYELVVKFLVGMIVVCFGLVVIRTGIDVSALLNGFFGFHLPGPQNKYPVWDSLQANLDRQAAALSLEAPSVAARAGIEGFNVMIAGFAATVGINMTFLFPYSLQARGWQKEHIPLSRYDLWLGMLLPFVVATSLVIISAANQLHQQGPSQYPVLTLEQTAEGKSAINFKTPKANDLARALEPVTGPVMAHWIFGLGVLGMTISSITLMMLVCGFTMMELTGSEPNGKWYKFGICLPALGMLGPLIWSKYAFWMAVPTSIVCFILLPIAYISFFILHNSKAYLGEARPEGWSRVAWNFAMGLSILIVASGSIWMVGKRLGML